VVDIISTHTHTRTAVHTTSVALSLFYRRICDSATQLAGYVAQLNHVSDLL